MNNCPLSEPENEDVLWQGGYCRVILAKEPRYLGFYRVIWEEPATLNRLAVQRTAFHR